MTTRCRHFLLQALGDSVADSFRALLGEASMDKFNPDLLREEPTDKVSGNGLPQDQHSAPSGGGGSLKHMCFIFNAASSAAHVVPLNQWLPPACRFERC